MVWSIDFKQLCFQNPGSTGFFTASRHNINMIQIRHFTFIWFQANTVLLFATHILFFSLVDGSCLFLLLLLCIICIIELLSIQFCFFHLHCISPCMHKTRIRHCYGCWMEIYHIFSNLAPLKINIWPCPTSNIYTLSQFWRGGPNCFSSQIWHPWKKTQFSSSQISNNDHITIPLSSSIHPDSHSLNNIST